MIPTPRPGPRFGECPDCGRQHYGECHLAEMERNREVDADAPFVIWARGKLPHREVPMPQTPLPEVRWKSATIAYGREEGGVVTPPPSLFDEALAHVMQRRAALLERLAKGPGGQS